METLPFKPNPQMVALLASPQGDAGWGSLVLAGSTLFLLRLLGWPAWSLLVGVLDPQ